MKSTLHKAIGPGLMYAGAAIGVSHLVQSTRAGADYGMQMIWLVLFACATKYVFLMIAPIYTASTGETLIQGYRRLGNWAVALYVLATLSTMFTIQASLLLVTAGLLGNFMQSFFGVVLASEAGLNVFYWTLVALALTSIPLLVGRYGLLDGTVKVVVSILAMCTVVAVVLAFFRQPAPIEGFVSPPLLTYAGLVFAFALIGWMPTPIDCSVWQSLWTLARNEQTGHKASVREATIDFNIGYTVATGLAIFFLMLGTLVMHGRGLAFPTQSVGFAAQLVAMYAEALGSWSRWLIAIAALTAMFSTTLTVTDAYPRVWRHLIQQYVTHSQRAGKAIYMICFAILNGVALVIVAAVAVRDQGQFFAALVDIATSLSVVAAPVLAYLNLRLITSEATPKEVRLGMAMMIFSRLCLIALIVMAIVFVYVRFIMTG